MIKNTLLYLLYNKNDNYITVLVLSKVGTMNTPTEAQTYALLNTSSKRAFTTDPIYPKNSVNNYHLVDGLLVGVFYDKKTENTKQSTLRKYTLVHDFKSGMSLEEAKSLAPLTVADLKTATVLDTIKQPEAVDTSSIIPIFNCATIVFNGFIVNTITTTKDGKDINYGYIQKDIDISTSDFREVPIIPMIVNHTLRDGIYCVNATYKYLIYSGVYNISYLIRFVDGLAQGYGIAIGNNNKTIKSQLLYHNGLLITKRDDIESYSPITRVSYEDKNKIRYQKSIYSTFVNRRLSKVVYKDNEIDDSVDKTKDYFDEDNSWLISGSNGRGYLNGAIKDNQINYYEGKLHGLYDMPTFKGVFEHGYLKGQITHISEDVKTVLTLRTPLQRNTATDIDKWFSGCINPIHAIGQVNSYDVKLNAYGIYYPSYKCNLTYKKTNKLIKSFNVDSYGFKQGSMMLNGVITWYWKNKPISQAEFNKRNVIYTVTINQASGLIMDLSNMVTQYLH